MRIAFAVVAVISQICSAIAACDYQKLSTCTSPKASNFCAEYKEYKECATDDAGCEDTQAFKSIYEGAVAAGCIQLTAKAQITSTMGTLKVASPKDVCFQYGPDMTCISEVDKHIDDILEKQFVFAKNITELKEELVNTIGKELQVLQTEMAIKVGALEDSVEANTAELEGHCGRHCYPGEYASTPCSPGQKTVCSECTGATFSVGGLAVECSSCATCTDQQYKTKDCTLTSNSKCDDCTRCPAGLWGSNCKNSGTAHCKKHKVCPSNQYLVTAGTPTSDTVCKPCTVCESKKFFQTKACSATADTTCSPCSTCQAGTQMRDECGKSTDRTCGPFIHNGKLSGDGWKPFMWYTQPKNRAGKQGDDAIPDGWISPFQQHYETRKNCNWGKDDFCFSRMPKDTDEFQSELLVMDGPTEAEAKNIYKWRFLPENPISHGTFAAMRDHMETHSGARTNLLKSFPEGKDQQWRPTVLKGRASSAAVDSMQFRGIPTTGGKTFWSLQVDDDGGWCQTVLELGFPLSSANFDRKAWGMSMRDTECTSEHGKSWPDAKDAIYLFVRQAKQPSDMGLGWEEFWTHSAGYGRKKDMLGIAHEKDKRNCVDKKESFGMTYKEGICYGRMPPSADIDRTQLLAIDNHGNAFVWRFTHLSNTAKRMWKSMTVGWNGGRGRWPNGQTFNPKKVFRGKFKGVTQDSWQYSDQCSGIRSFALDDDTCYCLTTIEAGKPMCGGGCGANVYGVDKLYDEYCQQTQDSHHNGLTMYWRDCTNDNVYAGCGDF